MVEGGKMAHVVPQNYNNVFIGRFFHSIDSKGRLSIPSQFRSILHQKYKTDKIIVTSLDKSLSAYPISEWFAIQNELQKLPKFDPKVRRFKLLFISGATECSFDKQGRILIPPALREHAGLKKEVLIAGVIERFEIWDKKRWEEEMKAIAGDFESITEKVGGLGI